MAARIRSTRGATLNAASTRFALPHYDADIG
jgi:hypothetical protein